MFATVESVKAEGNLTGVDVTLVSPHLLKAETELKTMLPQATLDEIDTANGDDKTLMTSAESLLALHTLIPVLVTVAGAQGGLVRTLGTGESTTTYLTHFEARKIAKDYRVKALKIIHRFKTGTPTDHVRAPGLSIWPL